MNLYAIVNENENGAPEIHLMFANVIRYVLSSRLPIICPDAYFVQGAI